MQIAQIPLPPTSNVVTQPQTLPNTLPQVLTQAVAPISQKAIAPMEKLDRGQKSRRRGGHGDNEREKEQPHAQEGRGDFVNISV